MLSIKIILIGIIEVDMCGRFSLTTPWELLKERFDVDIPAGEYRLRYNAAPGQDLWVIPEETPNDAQLFHWGLVPFWAKDPKIGNTPD